MNPYFQILLSLLCLHLSLSDSLGQTSEASGSTLSDYVNPFIGTGGHGHTYPGATTPFGMVQLSPDTRLTGWDGCSGYHFSDEHIYGFTHTHLSGTGVSDYGDILFMPYNGPVIWNNGADGQPGYRSQFSHTTEVASPGFYSVQLDDAGARADMTVTPRGGIHHYEFDENTAPSILLDLVHRDKVLSSSLRIVSPTRIEGHRRSSAWATDQHVYFVAEFSEPIFKHTILYGERELNINSAIGNKIKAGFVFNAGIKTLEIKIAISPVDVSGAWKNFDAELKDITFDEAKLNAEKLWNTELGKIEANFNHPDEQVIFYSALYHTMLAPNLYMDVDGRYRDMDLNIYQSHDHTHYTVFSLWDTYRAAHPLYTLIDQKRTRDYIKTFLKKHESGGTLPIWDLSACYTGCMIGNHAIPVIADAYIKGINDFDAQAALDAMKHVTMLDRLGLQEYKNKGFISVEHEPESVSKTLEYAYDDYCVAVMAQKMGESSTANTYFNRSLSYRNLFDPTSGFFRGRMHNTWQGPFDPFEVNNNYTEANAWQYGYYVPHDMTGFIALHGGKKNLDKKLDDLFIAQEVTSGRDQADITGLLGQYAHGNEPSHHIAYLYNFVNKPWKTQEKVREIMRTMYQNTPDGISGNEDCGQMSAWYIFSSLGFYPVTPASSNYIIGSPTINTASINLENGNQFKISTTNNSIANEYIQSIELNGQAYTKSYLTHQQIMNGGEMKFIMGAKPSETWGQKDTDIPITAVRSQTFVTAPFISSEKTTFIDKMSVAIGNVDQAVKTYYSFDANKFKIYKKPITIKSNCRIYIYSIKDRQHSDTLFTDFYKIDGGRSLTLNSQYASQYHAGGDYALIDGLRGTDEYRTGVWQGYEGQDLACTLDLGKIESINSVSCGFLQDHNSWIFMPSKVDYFISSDGIEFTLLGTVNTETPQRKSGKIIEYFTLNKPVQGRYIKMVANSLIKCPAWHKGYEYDGNCWVFADEIIIEN